MQLDKICTENPEEVLKKLSGLTFRESIPVLDELPENVLRTVVDAKFGDDLKVQRQAYKRYGEKMISPGYRELVDKIIRSGEDISIESYPIL